jgi:hypothetical protein
MHYLNEETTRLPSEVEGLIFDRPTSWQGMDLTWASIGKPELVYLRRLDVRGTPAPEVVHLLGARYELTEVLVGGDTFGDGYFLEYFVAEQSGGRWSIHRLLQSTSVTYSESDDEADYVPAAEVGDPRLYSLASPPAWKVAAAVWPTSGGVPMTFLGQVNLPDTDLTRRLLTWATSLFVFTTASLPRQFKVVEQNTTAQSAEEHYANEGE